MKISLTSKEKQAILAIVLCFCIYIAMPFVLLRFFPDTANFLKQNSLLLMIMPGITIYAVLSLYSKSFLIAKDDFRNIPFQKISLWSAMMFIVNAVGTLCWMEFLKWLKLPFDTSVPVEEFIKSCGTAELIAAGIFICILTPLIEESVFRRVIYEGLRDRCPPIFSITLASLLFAALHGILFQLFSLFILGNYFQILYCRERKLGSSVYAHFFNNSFAFIMLILFKYFAGDLNVPQ